MLSDINYQEAHIMFVCSHQILPTPVADSSGKTDEAKTIHNTSARLAGGLFDDDEDDLFATVHSTRSVVSMSTLGSVLNHIITWITLG